MEDLGRNIERWRRELPASLTERPDVIDELEGHLRDELAQLMAGGMRLDEAWPIAVRRLGSPDSLATEFDKVPPARWLPATVAGALLILAAVGIGGLIASRVLGGMRLLLAAHTFAVTLGYLAALVTGGLAVWVVAERLCRGDRSGSVTAFRRAAGGLARVSLVLTGVGVVLGAVWASGNMGRAWGWDTREVGGLGVLVCAALSAAAQRHGARAGMAAALVGSLVTVLAWFGPWMVEASRGAGVAVALGVVLGTVVTFQLVTMSLVLVPARVRETSGRF